MTRITELLHRMRSGDSGARNDLFEVGYPELRKLARARLRDGGRKANLDTTSLVHETYLRFLRSGDLRAEDRRAFLAYASRVMRSVIVDAARERGAECRGGGAPHQTLSTELIDSLGAGENAILRVHEAVTELAKAEPRLALVVEMRFFGGFSDAEIGDALDITPRTVQRDWFKAKALLSAMLLS